MWLDFVLVVLNVGMAIFCIQMDNAILASIAGFAAGVYYGEFKEQFLKYTGE